MAVGEVGTLIINARRRSGKQNYLSPAKLISTPAWNAREMKSLAFQSEAKKGHKLLPPTLLG
jgi:hypothetical protein